MFVVEDFRSQFPLIEKPPYEPFIYADNAATTQKPKVVLDKIDEFYRTSVSNVHRGAYRLSDAASGHYESARKYITNLFKAHECIFVRGATEGLNLLACSLGEQLKDGDHVLLSIAEHHANIVCWQQLAHKKNITLHYAPLDHLGCIDAEYCMNLFEQYPIKIVSMVHVSNTLGTLQPLSKIFKAAHEKGAITIADCCQSLPAYFDEIPKLNADFAVFSGHKIFAPTGIGCVLVNSPEILEKMQPYQTGGGMIAHVTTSHVTFAKPPACFEAGTPFIEGAFALKVALEFITAFDSGSIKTHLTQLSKQALTYLKKYPELKSFFINNNKRTPVFSVALDSIHSHDLATFLDVHGICARAGHHCTMPLLRELGADSTLRLSFALYNTTDEVKKCFDVLLKAMEFFNGR